jgi:hypothetical protein
MYTWFKFTVIAPGQVLIMCLSDGRANIPLSSALGGHFKDDSESWESASSGRDTLRVEVLAAADNLKKLNGRGVHFLMVRIASAGHFLYLL